VEACVVGYNTQLKERKCSKFIKNHMKISRQKGIPTRNTFWIIKLFEGLPKFLRVSREGFLAFQTELMRVLREGLI